jgi:hypothetical protein
MLKKKASIVSVRSKRPRCLAGTEVSVEQRERGQKDGREQFFINSAKPEDRFVTLEREDEIVRRYG